ncbi:class I SAM-dependent methyltransferase [Microbulbifer hydrolyticus]|uniref:Methyltransferase n=1 Tax=Microbulbifer hydrolyticus TaxID=48074 RepID=A0A6P1TDT7_9GAMM|nr:class I SAM-dependent methyltransferase [Microbulbifer hydrolyticus]MBB5212028.1 putative methyltransferase [Microbulbifer hydrolyticus]QHQ39710.1 methyltransferase [Microbulbifer hydrolyticus]
MKVVHWLAGMACAVSLVGAAQADTLKQAIEGDQRTPAYAARDQYRHPAETLEFFQVKPDMTVVEIWPGGGWYTEILAPALKEEGTFYAAHFPKDSKAGYFKRSREAFEKMLRKEKATYGAVKLTEFAPGGDSEIAPEGSADVVLTFRNVHNWMGGNNEQAAFNTFYKALKPGGVLGVVEHRAKPGTSREDMKKSGYVTQDYVIKLAKNAGFELEETSEINANPKDTADHPKGVWTLPPSLRLGDEDKDKYQAIGESDRMTLRFRKPQS